MSVDEFNFAEIVDINDDLLIPWFALYETSFPPTERELVAEHLRCIKEKSHGLNPHLHYVAMLDNNHNLAAIIRYSERPDLKVATLWHLAVDPERRNQGIGFKCHQEIKRRALEAGSRAMIFEVEMPEDIDDENLRELARRRIEFYRRQGAKLLSGIEYFQYVGPHQPMIPMHIMIHPLEPITAQEALEMAKAVFGDLITQVDVPQIE